MLYPNPEIPARVSLLTRAVRAVAGLSKARRRRLAQLDLLAMSPHIKRDLGLEAYTVLGR
jgi:hypothetical protein